MSLSLALVGIGKIARDQHLPAIAASADWRLACTVSRNATVDGVPGYSGIEEMLEAEPGVQVVSLALPPAPRYAAAMAALEAGKHVMLEKPPGMGLGEVQALERKAREAGVTLYATWHSRAAAAVPAARAFLEQARLKRLTITWKEDVRHWHPGQDWVWEPGGMGVFDPGINALSILTEILPVPISLAKADLAVPANRQTPVAADLSFRHPDGAEMTAALDWLHPGPPAWDIEAETDRGTLALREGGARIWIDGVEQATENADASALGGEYPLLYARMAELVRTGRSDVDLSPFVLVADAFLLGRRREVAAFEW
jgi:D-galactose 1-dehydrogenase